MIENNQIKPSWVEAIQEYEQHTGRRVTDFLKALDEAHIRYYPSKNDIFKCFTYFELKDTKIIILGQDPYHTPGQATGLAFQCATEISQPSLRNIETVLGHKPNFEEWAQKGVLLLNTALTVEEDKAESHLKQWKPFTMFIIDLISRSVPDVLFVCWGAKARDLCKTVKNCVVCSHPSPLSARKPCGGAPSFMDSKIFEYIQEKTGITL